MLFWRQNWKIDCLEKADPQKIENGLQVLREGSGFCWHCKKKGFAKV